MLIAIQCVFGGVVASLLGFLLISRENGKKVGSLGESRTLRGGNVSPNARKGRCAFMFCLFDPEELSAAISKPWTYYLSRSFTNSFLSSTEVRCLVDVPGQKLPSIVNGEMAKHLKSAVAPQVASTVIFTIIETEGVWQIFFLATLSSCYRAPHAR